MSLIISSVGGQSREKAPIHGRDSVLTEEHETLIAAGRHRDAVACPAGKGQFGKGDTSAPPEARLSARACSPI